MRSLQDTEPGISIHDITEKVRFCVKKHFSNRRREEWFKGALCHKIEGEGWEYFLLLLRRSHQRDGVVHLLSRHTTTALSINEDETRLREDQSWENPAIKCLFCWNFPITDAKR